MKNYKVEKLPNGFIVPIPDSYVLNYEKNEIIAFSWRQELFAIQQMLNMCISFCYSQEKPVLFASESETAKKVERSFFLNFGFILAQALIDKVYWQLKEFFKIEMPSNNIKWRPIGDFLIKNKGKDNNIKKILKLSSEFNECNERKIIETRANDIKHSWMHHYFGVKYKINESNFVDTNVGMLDVPIMSFFMKRGLHTNDNIKYFRTPTGKPTANIEDDIINLNKANTKLVYLILEINKILFEDIAKFEFIK